MFGEEKNLKDSSNDSDITIKDNPLYIPYTKANKLITALYMVTDIIDKDEPLRNKLRTLGTGVVSDMNFSPLNACGKISVILSFLDIASALNIISEMNCNILKKEFIKLNSSIRGPGDKNNAKTDTTNRQIDLSEFFKEELPGLSEDKGHYTPIGHYYPTRIGVQKGSTLLKALSDKIDRQIKPNKPSVSRAHDFDILKKQRRFEIITLIQKNGGSTTITDIKNKAYGSLVSCGEKTLQRELISMVKDGVLNKTGEKRWSKYFLK